MSNKTSALNISSESLEDNVSLTRSKSRYVRYFFVGMACLLLLLAVLGFGPSYQAMSDGALKVHWLVHVHGAVMGGWLLLFLVQIIVASKGNLTFHRQLGLFSTVYGAMVELSMLSVTIRAGVTGVVLLLQLHVEGLFALFFICGILVRKNAPAHKRLLLLATLVLLLAAIGRIQWLPGISQGPPVFFIYLDTLLIPLFVYDLLIVGRIHKITLLGCACLIAAQLIVLSALR